jgi:hypothetical protein
VGNLSYPRPSASFWELTLAEVLAQTAARFPDCAALVSRHQDLRLTWRFRGRGARACIGGYKEWRIGDDGLIAKSLGHFDAADYQRQIDHGA